MRRRRLVFGPILACLAGLAGGVGAQKNVPVLVLPPEGERGVSGRYVERLADAIATTHRGRDKARVVTLSRSALRRCRDDRECLREEGRRLGAERVIETRLSEVGDDFQVDTRIRDLESDEVLETGTKTISHYRLSSQGAATFEAVLGRARRPAPSPGQQTAPGESREEEPEVTSLASAEERQLGAGETEPPRAAPAPAPDESEVGALRPSGRPAPTDPGEPPQDGVRPHGAPVEGTEAGDQYQEKRFEREQGRTSGTLMGTTKSEPGLQGERSWTSDFQDRRKSIARHAHGPNGGREQLILMGWFLLLSVVAFLIGFGAVRLLPAVGRAARRSFRFTVRLGAKEEALNLALLRGCCKATQVGVIMSPECELTRRFRFSMLDGSSLAIDVIDHKKTDLRAFRKGATLLAHFVHEDRSCACMLTAQATRMSRKQLRVVLQVAGKFAEVEVPRDFAVPVAEDLQLRVQLSLQKEGKEQRWLARVGEISAHGLRTPIEQDTPQLAGGEMLDATLRLPDARVDIQTKVLSAEGGYVALEVLPEEGKAEPCEQYGALVRRIELSWMAPRAA